MGAVRLLEQDFALLFSQSVPTLSKISNSHQIPLSFLLFGLRGSSPARAYVVTVDSPQKRVQLALDSFQGKLSYRVTIQGKTVVSPSALGIIVDGQNLAGGVSI